MNRRDFLKSIGVTVFGIPFIPKFHSGGIVDPKHYITISGPLFNPVSVGGVQILSMERPYHITEDGFMVGTKITYRNFRGEVWNLVVGCGDDDFEVCVKDGMLDVANNEGKGRTNGR